ncbi:MAG: hypothetical protein M1820_001507 [Bogoriella megaspora]|nr:MAG: hypothetical protein M1820_001507 [Bogoriella megaspora]
MVEGHHVEPISDYCLGGYHPIHIGDSLNEGRYKILNKLGWGGSSTVWLASDRMRNNACVAISITRADKYHEYTAHLSRKISHLEAGDNCHPGKRSMLIPLDSFHTNGPNGQHFCLVMRFEGQTISRATNRAQGPNTRPLPLQRAKKAVWDLVQGIDYMHKQGITHGDLHPANLYLGIPNEQDWSVPEIEAVCGPPKLIPNESVTGDYNASDTLHHDHQQPRYRVADAMEHDVDLGLFPGPVKIADFALAFYDSENAPKMPSGGPFIVPEFNAPGHCSSAADIWLLGCDIFQFLSGFDLMGTLNDPPWKMVHGMMRTLGSPPTYLFESWKLFAGDAHDVVWTAEASQPLELRIRQIREGDPQIGMKERKDDFSDDDITLLTDLLTFMVRFEPFDRPTIGQIIDHPAMQYFCNSQD